MKKRGFPSMGTLLLVSLHCDLLDSLIATTKNAIVDIRI
jgi:hypothetical protein